MHLNRGLESIDHSVGLAFDWRLLGPLAKISDGLSWISRHILHIDRLLGGFDSLHTIVLEYRHA